MTHEPICVGCNTKGEEIEEYQQHAINDKYDIESIEEYNKKKEELGDAEVKRMAVEYIKREEGTYNPENGHFLCTPCYVKAGCPSSPRGWKAP